MRLVIEATVAWRPRHVAASRPVLGRSHGLEAGQGSTGERLDSPEAGNQGAGASGRRPRRRRPLLLDDATDVLGVQGLVPVTWDY
jgi:hypothetical protein